jgi:hypothetical protein
VSPVVGRRAANLGVLFSSLVLGACGGDSEDGDTTVSTVSTVVIQQEVESDDDKGPIPTTRDTSPSTVAYEQFISTHGGFSADIPTGDGWSGPQETVEGDGQIYRTTFTGPDGLSILIDFTPDIRPEFNGSYDSKQTVPQPVYGEATEIVFTGGAFPQCDLGCVDYLIPDNGTSPSSSPSSSPPSPEPR